MILHCLLLALIERLHYDFFNCSLNISCQSFMTITSNTVLLLATWRIILLPSIIQILVLSYLCSASPILQRFGQSLSQLNSRDASKWGASYPFGTRTAYRASLTVRGVLVGWFSILMMTLIPN